MFELVIFDCDGVLVDSEPAAVRTWVDLAEELGLSLGWEEAFKLFVGRTRADNIAALERRIGKQLPGAFGDLYETRLFATLRQGLQPVPGVIEALDEITTPICVASSGAHSKMRLTLGLTGLLARFEGRMFSATEVARGKPYPDVFLYAAARMGTTFDRCAVVEDSLAGVQAGVAAGMSVFGFGQFSDAVELAVAGARVFAHMHDLPSLLTEHSA